MEKLKCPICSGDVILENRGFAVAKINFTITCTNKNCNFVRLLLHCNAESEAIEAFKKATRAERKLSNSIVMCLDTECCGVLGEEYNSDIVCNECGKKYSMWPFDVKQGIQWISVKDKEVPKDGKEYLTRNDNQGKTLSLIRWNRVYENYFDKGNIILSLQCTHWAEINLPENK